MKLRLLDFILRSICAFVSRTFEFFLFLNTLTNFWGLLWNWFSFVKFENCFEKFVFFSIMCFDIDGSYHKFSHRYCVSWPRWYLWSPFRVNLSDQKAIRFSQFQKNNNFSTNFDAIRNIIRSGDLRDKTESIQFIYLFTAKYVFTLKFSFKLK